MSPLNENCALIILTRTCVRACSYIASQATPPPPRTRPLVLFLHIMAHQVSIVHDFRWIVVLHWFDDPSKFPRQQQQLCIVLLCVYNIIAKFDSFFSSRSPTTPKEAMLKRSGIGALRCVAILKAGERTIVRR